MSDYIVKIIPVDPFYKMEATEIEQIVSWMKSEISAEQIDFSNTEKPVFVDCGGNLDCITCPVCGCELDFGWWGEKMGESCEESGFENLNIQTPCCKKNISLNNLCYNFPCGFSCLEIDIHNPEIDIEDCFLKQFCTQTGIEAKIIRARI